MEAEEGFGLSLTAQAGTLGESEAAALSVKYAQIAMPVGQLVSTPAQVNAKLEFLMASSEAMICLGMIRLLVNRLARGAAGPLLIYLLG